MEIYCIILVLITLTLSRKPPKDVDVCRVTKNVNQYIVTSSCDYCRCNDLKNGGIFCMNLCITSMAPSKCHQKGEEVITYQKRMDNTNCICIFSLCGVPDYVSLKVQYGKSISLNCSRRKAYWNLNNKAIFSRKDKYLATYSNLRIYNVTPSDSGVYSCGTKEIFTVTVMQEKISKKKNEKSDQLSTAYILLISIFGFIFAATALLIGTAFVQRRCRDNLERNDSGGYAEIDEYFLIQVNDIYNNDERVDEGEEILPRDMQFRDSLEIQHMCEGSEYVYVEDYNC